MQKGCRKDCRIKQTVENQALREILYAFTHMRKNYPKPARPTYRLTSQSVGTIFALKNPIFSIHLHLTVICVIKCVKSLKIKDFRLSASFSACFLHAFCKLALLQKTGYNKTHPTPTPCPAPP
jgi:hypothetical protein